MLAYTPDALELAGVRRVLKRAVRPLDAEDGESVGEDVGWASAAEVGTPDLMERSHKSTHKVKHGDQRREHKKHKSIRGNKGSKHDRKHAHRHERDMQHQSQNKVSI